MMHRWFARFLPPLSGPLLGLGLLAAVFVGAQTSGRASVTTSVSHSASSAQALSVRSEGELLHTVYLPFAALQHPPYELRINAGGPVYTSTQGELYLADQPYNRDNGLGHIDGEIITRWDSDWRPMGGTSDHHLYTVGRANLSEYRFDVPNGSYLVCLKFAELYHHAVGQRVFDVQVESEKVLDAFDIFASGNLWYAVDVPVTAVVTDHQLNVVFTPSVGVPLINAIAVTNDWSDIITPTPPSDVRATGNYNRILMDWKMDNSIATRGYRVYRTTKVSGAIHSFTSSLQLVPYYLDDDVLPGQTYSYTVRTVDVSGHESIASPVVTAASRTYSDTTLPVYHLAIALSDLASLNANVWSDEYVPATFVHDGESYAVGVRYRGFWGSRDAPKKSWNVRFDTSHLFDNQRRLNLNSEFVDWTLMKEKISHDLFESFGLSVSKVDYVLLDVNGEHRGLYAQVEQIDEYFLIRSGRQIGSNIYKVNYPGDLRLRDDPTEYEAIYEKKTNQVSGYGELIALIELVNRTPDDQFATTIAKHLNVANYLKYYAVVILTANPDVPLKDYYLIYDPVADMWEVLPWDNASTFWDSTKPIDEGVPQHLLLTRVLDVPEFRLYYARLLIEAMADQFTPETIEAMVDSYYDLIAFDATRDIWRRYWYSRDFDPSLTSFVIQRNAYLQSVVYSYTAGLTLPLTLELTPAGDQLVIHNQGLLDWQVGGMTVRSDQTGRASWVLPADTVVPAGESLVLWDLRTTTTSLLPAAADAFSEISRIELFDKPVHNARLVARWARMRTRQNLE